MTVTWKVAKPVTLNGSVLSVGGRRRALATKFSMSKNILG